MVKLSNLKTWILMSTPRYYMCKVIISMDSLKITLVLRYRTQKTRSSIENRISICPTIMARKSKPLTHLKKWQNDKEGNVRSRWEWWSWPYLSQLLIFAWIHTFVEIHCQVILWYFLTSLVKVSRANIFTSIIFHKLVRSEDITQLICIWDYFH